MNRFFFVSAFSIALLFSGKLQATPSACSSVPGNLVTNCGFETGTLSGWTATPAGYLNQYYGVDSSDANTGAYGAYLAGQTANAYLSQVLSTVAGTTYYVTFDLAHPDPTYSPYTDSFIASFGSGTVYSESNQQFGYTKFVLSGTATSSSTTLQFGAFDPTSFFSLDDVAVYVAPEPSTLALSFPFVLVAAIFVVRRRQALA